MPALALCLARAGASVVIATAQFSLSWTHSIEKIRWDESWQVTPAGLVVTQATIRGSGAGMEPPADAVWRDGAWWYRPTLPPQPQVTLAASDYTADHTLCALGRCAPMHEWIVGSGPVTMRACTPPAGTAAENSPAAH